MSEFTEAQERVVAAIVKDVIRAELKDPDSTLRLVLDRSLGNLEDSIVTRMTGIMAPVIVKTERSLTLAQEPPPRAPWTLSTVLDMVIRVSTAGGLLYVFFKYLQSH